MDAIRLSVVGLLGSPAGIRVPAPHLFVEGDMPQDVIDGTAYYGGDTAHPMVPRHPATRPAPVVIYAAGIEILKARHAMPFTEDEEIIEGE